MIYLYDALPVSVQLLDVLGYRIRHVRRRKAFHGQLQLLLEAGNGAVDPRDLAERPPLDAVVPAEPLQGCRGDGQFLLHHMTSH